MNAGFDPAALLWAGAVPALVLVAGLWHLFRQGRRNVEALAACRQQLDATGRRLALALEGAREGGWEWLRRDRRLHLSAQAAAVLGWGTPAVPPSLACTMRQVHPDDRRALHAALWQHLRRERPFDHRCRVCLPDGSMRWIRLRGRAWRDAHAQVVSVSGFVADVTAAHLAEDAGSQLAARHASVLMALPDLMFELDERLRILRYHAADARDLLRSPDQFLGRPMTEVLPGPVARQFEDACRAVREGTPLVTLDYVLTLGDGRPADFEGRVVQIRTGGFLCIVRNITARKAQEAELRRHRDNLAELMAEQTVDLMLARDAAERARLAQARFLAGLAHDLRSPLHALVGFAEIGQAHPGDSVRQGYCLEKIHDSARRLIELSAQLADVSRAELDDGQVALVPVDWEVVCRDVLVQAAPMLAAKRLRPEVTVPEPVCPVRADGRRLHRVVEHLVTNAVRFAPLDGALRLALACRPEGPNGREVVLTVSGEGVGMGDLAADPAGGIPTGADPLIGGRAPAGGALSLCRQYVEAFAGRIETDATDADNGCVRIALPCARSACRPAAERAL